VTSVLHILLRKKNIYVIRNDFFYIDWGQRNRREKRTRRTLMNINLSVISHCLGALASRQWWNHKDLFASTFLSMTMRKTNAKIHQWQLNRQTW